MALIWRWPCSLFFIIQMYLMMALMGVFFTPWALFDRAGVFAGVHCYCRWVRWTAAWMVGLRSEVRSRVPQGEALIASKHQSFFDIILICSVTPRPKFIMKKELLRAPRRLCRPRLRAPLYIACLRGRAGGNGHRDGRDDRDAGHGIGGHASGRAGFCRAGLAAAADHSAAGRDSRLRRDPLRGAA